MLQLLYSYYYFLFVLLHSPYNFMLIDYCVIFFQLKFIHCLNKNQNIIKSKEKTRFTFKIYFIVVFLFNFFFSCYYFGFIHSISIHIQLYTFLFYKYLHFRFMLGVTFPNSCLLCTYVTAAALDLTFHYRQ